MKKLLYFLFIFLSFTVTAQVPEPDMISLKGIGGNGSDKIGTHITKTKDGGFIIRFETGSSIGSGNIDSLCAPIPNRMIFSKYNGDATVIEWSKCYGFGGDSFITHIFPANSGDYVWGGQFNSSTSYGWLVTKQDAGGNTVWQRNYSKGKGSILRAMMATEDGGYIMTGGAYQTDTNVLSLYGGSMTADIWVLKVDSNGYKVWSKVIGGTGNESVAALVPAPGNGCYVVGGTGSYDYDCTGNPGGGTAYLARLDHDGNMLWHRCLGGSSHDAATAACSNNKGGVILAVNTSSNDVDVHNYHGGSDYWAVEVDSEGTIVWDNCYGTTGDEVPQAICKATDGSVWINGYTTDGYDDVYIVKADSVGILESSTLLSTYQQDRGLMIYPLINGYVLAGGYYYASHGSFASLTNYGTFDAFLAIFSPWNVGIKDKTSEKSGFKIYPNPATESVNIKAIDNSLCRITVYDILGRMMYDNTITKNIQIPVNEWRAGLYFVQIVSENGYTEVQKLIVR
ncbi:MAG: T9SS type A sorting domain-containing protein [Taibaiella sp.]|nr:T9SS type A sorting domain-containing protein [Taibaiella sp.]